jgi:hypothetical protein
MHVRTKIGNTSGWTTSSSTPIPNEYCTSQLHVRAGLKAWAPRRMNAVCFSPFIGRDVTPLPLSSPPSEPASIHRPHITVQPQQGPPPPPYQGVRLGQSRVRTLGAASDCDAEMGGSSLGVHATQTTPNVLQCERMAAPRRRRSEGT